MNPWFAAPAVAVMLFAAPVLAQDKPPIVARAENCLRANVERVVAADPDMDSAANFLLNYACASEVSGAARYEMNVALVKQFSVMGAAFAQVKAGPKSQLAQTTSATVDPETGDIVTPPSKPGAEPDLIASTVRQMGTSAGQFTQLMMPTSLRQLTGALVLEARERQLSRAQ